MRAARSVLDRTTETIQSPHGAKDVSGVGPLAAVLCQEALSRQRARSRSNSKASAFPFKSRLRNSHSTEASKAGIGQGKAEQVFPVDPAANGVGGSSVRQVFAELQQRRQSETPWALRRLPGLGKQVGELLVGKDRAEPVPQPDIGIALREHRPSHGGRVGWNGIDRPLDEAT